MKKMLIVLLGVILVSSTLFANNGTTSAAFMKFGAGGRASGLGNAYTAIATDATAGYWNIGALSMIKNNSEVSFMYNDIYQGLSHNYLSYVHKLDKNSAISAELSYFKTDDIQKIQIDPTNYTPNPVGSFTSKDYYFSVGYSKIVQKNFSLGVNAKIIKSEIDIYSASAFAIDLGSYYRVNEDLTYGFVIKNIGSKLKYQSTKEDLPLNVVLGLGYNFLDNLLIAADINFPKNESTNFKVGLEYSFNKNFCVRTGYDDANDADNSKLNFGFGLNFKNFNVDYAFLPAGDLGDSHKFSLIYNF